MIKVTDKFTAATVQGILTDAKEVEYNYGIENPATSATVATALDEMENALADTVMLGEESVGPYEEWEIGTAEQYVDERIQQVEGSVDYRFKLMTNTLSTINGNEVIVGNKPTTGEIGIIYRVPGSTSYTDWMWDVNGASPQWAELATYAYPGQDTVPTSGSTKLITSGGAYDAIFESGIAFDVSRHLGGATFSSLANAIAGNNIPANYRSGGLTVRYLGTDGKYHQYYNATSAWTTNASDWSGVADTVTSGSTNIVSSAGIYNEIVDKVGTCDVTRLNNGTKYATLQNAINAVPNAYQRGGLRISYVQTSDQKYVSFVNTNKDWSSNPSDWTSGGGGDGVFDISQANASGGDPATYDNLEAAISGTNVPEGVRAGGMSLKYIENVYADYGVVVTEGLTEQPTGTALQSAPSITDGVYKASQLSAFLPLPSTVGASNTYYIAVTVDETTTYTKWVVTKKTADSDRYVQYRLMTKVWSIVVSDWQGVDEEPIPGSKNLVISGAVYDGLEEKAGRSFVKNLFDKNNPNNGISSFFSRPLSHKIFISTKKIYFKNINSCIVVYDSNDQQLGYSLSPNNKQGSGYSLYTINSSWNAAYIRVSYTNNGDNCFVFEGDENLSIAYNESPQIYELPSPYQFDWINRDSPYFGVDSLTSYMLTDIMYIPEGTESIIVKGIAYYTFLSDTYAEISHQVITKAIRTVDIPNGAKYLRVGCNTVDELRNAMVTTYSIYETLVPTRNNFIPFVITQLNSKSLFSKKNVVITGDSIAKGYGDIEDKHGWSGRVCDSLGAVMIDYTKSGASAAKRSNNIEDINAYSFVETSKSIAQLTDNIEAIFVAFGTNDQGNQIPKSPLLDVIGEPEDEYNFTSAYYYSLKRIIEAKPNASIFLLNYFTNDTSAGSYYELIKSIGEYLSIPVIDVLHESGITPNVSFLSTLYFSDGLHPNSAGYKKMAKCVMGKIKNWAILQ